MSGELVVEGVSTKVTIRDISANGALIVTEKPLTECSKVELKRGELRAYGHVAWAHGRQAGIKFDEPLAPGVLQKTMPKAILRSLDIDRSGS